MASKQQLGHPCNTCKHHLNNKPDPVHLQYTLGRLTNKKGKKGPREEIFEVFKSFLNGKGGSVLIHSDEGVNIDLFPQQVDHRLLELIPDNALYQGVYERYLLDDHHVLYRVKPQDSARPPSVQDFSFKISLDKGISDPTDGQIQEFVEHPFQHLMFNVNRLPKPTKENDDGKRIDSSVTEYGQLIVGCCYLHNCICKSYATFEECGDVLTKTIKSLNKFDKNSYVEDTTLSGANPVSQNCPLVNKCKDKNKTRHEQLLKLNIPQKELIFKTVNAYVKDSPAWCEWTSMTLSEDLDLPVIAVPPCTLMQVFLIGVNLPPILLTCYEDHSLATQVREYANDTASALKWRLLDFCHLDFLLLPCIVLKNFHLKTLKDEIMTQLEDQSECYGGPTYLDEDMFQTMKAATTALAGSTLVPSIFKNSVASEMKTLVMEEEWRDVMSLLIEECSDRKKGVPFKLCLQPEDATKKVEVAVVETLKRWSVKNHVIFFTSTADSRLDASFKRLSEEMNEAYGVVLNVTQSSATAETDIDGNQTRDSETGGISLKKKINTEGISKQSKKETNGERRRANRRSKTRVTTNPSAHGSKNGRAKKVAKKSPRVSKRVQEKKYEPTSDCNMDESSRDHEAEAENMRPAKSPRGRMNWSTRSLAKKSPRVSKRVQKKKHEPTSDCNMDESSRDYEAEAENMRPAKSPRGRMNWSTRSRPYNPEAKER